VIYYSGFSLKEDENFFLDYIDDGEYTVSGFSYGAIQAFEFAVKSSKRVDKLQLFSPAFFQTKPERYIKLQLGAYSADKDAYLRLFIDNCFSPALNDGSAKVEAGRYESLKALLTYVWEADKIQKLLDRGVEIEVYLGGKDKIIDAQKAFEFFTPFATTYLIKEAGHFLKTKSN
jgi:pimeloyl-ACP methyl ester carboxylesterase